MAKLSLKFTATYSGVFAEAFCNKILKQHS